MTIANINIVSHIQLHPVIVDHDSYIKVPREGFTLPCHKNPHHSSSTSH